MKMILRGSVCVLGTLLTLSSASPALAQKVTEVPDLTGKQVLATLANPATAVSVGEIMGAMIATEVATAPFGTSAGGFVFKLDPATGLLARTTTTFGPSFTEHALTSGEGKISVGATFNSTSYDKLSDFALKEMPMGSAAGITPGVAGTTTADLHITSRTLAISALIGVTQNLDVGTVVPLVSVKLSGVSTLINASDQVARLAQTDNVFSGIGDIAAFAKYRFVRFKGPDIPDPGGVALYVSTRLPTGSRDNLRGLGVTRTLGSIVASFGTSVFRPHGSVGFEYWSKSVDVAGLGGSNTVKLRHQFQYAGGVEIAAAPKLTVLADVLGQNIMGGGPVVLGTLTPVTGIPGISASQSLALQEDGITKLFFVPGLKVNLKAKMVLSLNALVTLKNNGLHSKVVPVAGINLTM
ncbi:MAG TPA: hypothetical protein VN716_15880 [Vicinamibacterales bacterium]|jgi:hypothetical protein|nr:hypothetical protein [Vicinamibacterales bacterium]